jgi:hypothetical protein
LAVWLLTLISFCCWSTQSHWQPFGAILPQIGHAQQVLEQLVEELLRVVVADLGPLAGAARCRSPWVCRVRADIFVGAVFAKQLTENEKKLK